MAKNNLKQIICNFAIQIKHRKIMKKFYTAIAIVAMAFTAQAQTALNVNGSLEDWTDGTTSPDGWFFNNSLLSSGAIERIEGDAQDGDISVKIQSPDTSNNQAGLADIEVEAGETYTVSFWYKTEGDIKFRFWGQWRDDSASIQLPEGEVSEFLPAGYIEIAATEWTNMTITAIAPEGTTKIRPSFRNYNGGSDLYIDNVVLHVGEPTSTQKNNIEGLSIYPNPASDMVNVVSNSLSNKDIVITDLLGKTVLKANVSQSVNISSLKSGVYMMQITQDGKSATRKLIVK